MIRIIFPLLFASFGSSPDAVEADQFSRIIREQASPLKDLAFVYEGKEIWIGPKGVLKIQVEAFEDEFQGAYLARHDDSALLDLYVKNRVPTSSVVHRTRSLLHGDLTDIVITSDKKQDASRPRNIKRGHGNFGSLNGPQSPHTFLKIWQLLSFDKPLDWGYRFQGWEPIDGRTCLRFRVGLRPDGGKDELNYQQFWVDVEHGAAVLRYEYYRDRKLSTRVDSVTVFSFPLPDGGRFWLPVSAKMSGFEWDGQFFSEPVQQETTAIVAGSVSLNQGLPDGIFSVDRKSGLPLPGELDRLKQNTKHLALRHDFEAAPSAPAPRTDPVGVREQIEARLAAAEHQAAEINASSPARQFWNSTLVVQIIAVAIGVSFLVGAVFMKWRNQ